MDKAGESRKMMMVLVCGVLMYSRERWVGVCEWIKWIKKGVERRDLESVRNASPYHESLAQAWLHRNRMSKAYTYAYVRYGNHGDTIRQYSNRLFVASTHTSKQVRS